MLKRYSAYLGCNTTMTQIAKEIVDGDWVRFDDLMELIGCNDPQKTEHKSDYAKLKEAYDKGYEEGYKDTLKFLS